MSEVLFNLYFIAYPTANPTPQTADLAHFIITLRHSVRSETKDQAWNPLNFVLQRVKHSSLRHG